MDRPTKPVVVLVLLYIGYLLSFADRVLFGLVLGPIKASLGFSDSQLGLLSGLAFALSYALFAPAGGYLIDTLKRKSVFAFAVTFWSAATLFTGLAYSFWAMAISRFAVGIGECVINPLAVSLFSDTYSPKQRSRVFSIYFSAGAAGLLFAMVFGGSLVSLIGHLGDLSLPVLGVVEGWRVLFFAAAVPGFVLSVVILLVMTEPKRQSTNVSIDASENANVSGVSFLRKHVMLSAALFIGVPAIQMASYSFTTWNIVFFERAFDWRAGDAALFLGGFGGVSMLIGSLLTGTIISYFQKIGRTDAPVIACMLAAAFYLVAGAVMVLSPNPILSISAFVVFAFWGFVPTIAGYSMLSLALPPMIKARLAGLNTLTYGLITNSLGPFLVGLFSDIFFPGPEGIRFAMLLLLVIGTTIGVVLLNNIRGRAFDG